MLPLSARYHPPRQSRHFEVVVRDEGGGQISVWHGRECLRREACAALQLVPKLGSGPRILRFADGAACWIDPAEPAWPAWEEAFATHNRDWQRWVHRLESSWRWIAVACVMMLGILAFSYFVGLPWVAKDLALKTSPDMRAWISQKALTAIDQEFLQPSQLERDARHELNTIFRAFRADLGQEHLALKLEMRSSLAGPNAFALPDGHIIFTDELYELLDDEAQVIAVLAHEAGHVEAQHGLRSVLQNAGVALILTLMFGDVNGWNGVMSTLPLVLLQNAYSRDFEREADLYAATYLQEAGLGVTPMQDALRHLEGVSPGASAASLLSTHPAVSERIEALDAFAATVAER